MLVNGHYLLTVVPLFEHLLLLPYIYLQITDIQETIELRDLFWEGDAKVAQFVKESGFLKPVHK